MIEMYEMPRERMAQLEAAEKAMAAFRRHFNTSREGKWPWVVRAGQFDGHVCYECEQPEPEHDDDCCAAAWEALR